ncbi:Serine/threonine-protein kinase-like protein CR4 [Linum grandiflorum]
MVAVKKAIVSSDKQKNSKEFHTELDLLSRLNHAHLLNLLGYCEEGGERLLVYEFMAHGSLLHYLTTKSDVYSFGVLLLEILTGRKAIDMQCEEGNIVEWAVPLIRAGDTSSILDPVLKPPSDLEALKRIANVACKCVRMRGKERPSMDKVTTALERALAQLMGSPCYEQPILPTEVVLGSSRMHKKSSQRSSNRSGSETTEVVVVEGEEQRIELRAPSWITFPSVTSSQRRKSSASEADVEGKASEARNPVVNAGCGGDGLRRLEEEIGPASPREDLYLQHNF